MKFASLIAFFLFVTSAVTEAQHPSKTFSLAFYNTENMFDTLNDPSVDDEDFTPRGKYRWGERQYRSKVANIARVLRSVDSTGLDLIGLSEIENITVIDDLLQAMNERGLEYDCVHHNTTDLRGIDVALLFRKSRFRLEGSEQIAGKGYRQHLLVWGRVHDERLYVFITHLPSKGSSVSSRKRAAQGLRVAIDSIAAADRGAKIVVMGDLNDIPDGVLQHKILGFESKIIPLRLFENAATHFYNPFGHFAEQGRGSIVYRDRWQMFDCIVVNGNILRTNGLFYDPYYPTAELFQRPWMMERDGTNRGYPRRTVAFGKVQNGFSDHLPVVLRLMMGRQK